MWTRKTTSNREWPPLTANGHENYKLFLRMREWSNFTRNAIDELQIVLTNLKSKLGKFGKKWGNNGLKC